MYFTTLPDHLAPGFNEKAHFERFGKSNIIFNAQSYSSECEKHVGCFSIKTVLEGEETYGVNGRNLVVRPGQFLMLNDGQEYSCSIKGGSARTVSVFFKREYATEFFETLRDIDTTLSTQLGKLIFSLETNGYQQNEVDEHVIFILQTLQLVHGNDLSSLKRVQGIKASTQKEIYRRLCVARDLINSSYREDLDLESISKVSCLSVPQLVRQFKYVFDTTPHRYLTSVRLHRASDFLKMKRYSVSEVGVLCGFENASAFCRAFKGYFKVSPSRL